MSKTRYRRFLLLGLAVVIVMILAQYLSIRMGKKVAQSISEAETPGGTIKVIEE